MVGCLSLKQVMGVRFHLPELMLSEHMQRGKVFDCWAVATSHGVWVRVPRLPLLKKDRGLWSNRKTPVLQTGDSGAIPDEST